MVSDILWTLIWTLLRFFLYQECQDNEDDFDELREVLPKSVSDHFDILTNYCSYIQVSNLTVVIFPKYYTFYINVKEDCGGN